MIEEDRRRFAQMIGSLSLEDKTRLLTGKTAWRTWSAPAIGLREMVFSDGPVGVRGTGEAAGEASSCLPSPTALAACWDTAMAHRVGRWFAHQARRHGVDVVVIPRLETDGEAVSASRVRQLLPENNWDEIRRLVPPCTYEYLREKSGMENAASSEGGGSG
jgi:hypothetical protein